MSLETCSEVTLNKPRVKKKSLYFMFNICGSNTEINKVHVSFSISSHEILLAVRERCSSVPFLLKQRAVAPGGV